MSSRHTGGSKYPSAYGHTPSYRSYASIPDASASDFARDLTRDLGLGASSTAGVSAFNRNTTSSLLADTDLLLPTTSLRSSGGTSSAPSTGTPPPPFLPTPTCSCPRQACVAAEEHRQRLQQEHHLLPSCRHRLAL